jgi:hypothetical protein
MDVMQSARAFFDYLNHASVAVHRAKEELFWSTYLATSHDQGRSSVPRAPSRTSSAIPPS